MREVGSVSRRATSRQFVISWRLVSPTTRPAFTRNKPPKSLRNSVLAFDKQPILRTHNLTTLLDAIIPLHPSFIANLDELKLLTTYVIAWRYDDDF